MELNLITKGVPYLLGVLMASFSSAISDPLAYNFLQCLSQYPNATYSDFVFTPKDTEYSSVLESTIINLRFSTSTTPKPLAIITPLTYSHVQSTILCSKRFKIQIRIRSGGHDNAGLSYTSHQHSPFVVLDLRELRDLDLGENDNADNTSYLNAMKWGYKYFGDNFRRLAMVKGVVDPDNFFFFEQSIPPLIMCEGNSVIGS
ncbi:hypothetical protein L1987_84525 [Smallanthus sonchifolius]|uniref:Uncharacterized protein n=1 Tax=Smallanthus sonchifolius TaxID=185202 RepID=A0ACB8YFJ5_9ASTR|nr:hypothetical protein L1987_84525 [Smallanthus sonchifolius]